MNICLLGFNGFVGRTVCQKLGDKHNITKVGSKTSVSENDVFDLVVNCAGNSSKRLVSENWGLTQEIENNIYAKLCHMKMKGVIHISSIDAEREDTEYGVQKRAMERKVLELVKKNFYILRLGGLIGPGLSKNVIYDLLNNRPLYTQLESIYNFITTEEVANIIDCIIDNWKIDVGGVDARRAEWINVGASESISIAEIASLLNVTPEVRVDSKIETYQIDVQTLQKFYPVKTSKEYIKQFLDVQK